MLSRYLACVIKLPLQQIRREMATCISLWYNSWAVLPSAICPGTLLLTPPLPGRRRCLLHLLVRSTIPSPLPKTPYHSHSITAKFSPLIPLTRKPLTTKHVLLYRHPGRKTVQKSMEAVASTPREWSTLQTGPVDTFLGTHRHTLLLSQHWHPMTSTWHRPQARSARVTWQVRGNACWARMKGIPQQHRNSCTSDVHTRERL